MHVDVSYPISTGVIGARSCRTYTDTRKNTQTRREKREERGGALSWQEETSEGRLSEESELHQAGDLYSDKNTAHHLRSLKIKSTKMQLVRKQEVQLSLRDSNLHTRLAIVTENELGLAFPPRNLPKKFRPDPSTFYLVIVVTNRQTDKPTPVKT